MAIEREAVIYIAGDSDNYPYEYYDRDSGAFKGVVPELFEEFSRKYPYIVEYCDSDKYDKHTELAKNAQMDIISGAGKNEYKLEKLELFSVDKNGIKESYYAAFTDAAPDVLKEDLSAFAETITADKIAGLMENYAVAPESKIETLIALFTAVAAILGVIVFLLIKTFKYKRIMKEAVENCDTDSVTKLGNMKYLQRCYSEFIKKIHWHCTRLSI